MDFIGLIKAASFQPDRVTSSDAWVGHIPFAAWLVQTIKPSIFVELGTFTGNSYLAFCQSIKENKLPTQCYSVDTWKGDAHLGSYGEKIYHDLYGYHDRRYTNFSRLMRMTFDEAASSFVDRSIEMLHIDGLHTYVAVKHDFETWLPKLAPHALVLFHDVVVRDYSFGVWKLWNELSRQYPLNFEFIHSNGLGILQLSPGKGDFHLEWLQQDYEHRQLIREFFASLGKRAVDNYRLRETGRSLEEITKAADNYRVEINLARLSGSEREQKMGSLQVQLDTLQEQLKASQEQSEIFQQQMKQREFIYKQQMEEREHVYQVKNEEARLFLIQREKILRELNSKLLEIYSSTGWKFIQKMQTIRLWLMPGGSRREKIVRNCIAWLLALGSKKD